MTIIFAILILTLILVFGFHIICWLCNWASSLGRDNMFIKWSDFKKSYDVKPDQWDLRYQNVRFKIRNNNGYIKTTMDCSFYPIGYYRYRLWRVHSSNKKFKACKKAARQEIMSAIKSDIQLAEINHTSPSIEIEVDKKHRDTFIKSIQKYIKEELGMDVKVTNKEAKDETSI